MIRDFQITSSPSSIVPCSGILWGARSPSATEPVEIITLPTITRNKWLINERESCKTISLLQGFTSVT